MPMSSPSSNTPARDSTAFSNPLTDPLERHREALRRALGSRGLDAREVERVLGAFVGELKARGISPEGLVIALKQLLADQDMLLDGGGDTDRAFVAARDSRDLHGAIVTLAIAQYFGIDLRAADVTQQRATARTSLSDG
jgi:hypothetical protein